MVWRTPMSTFETFAVLGILAFTIAQAAGTALQSYHILKSHDATSVSVSWFANYIGICIAQINYGYWRDNDEIILYNAYVLAISQLPLLRGLWLYKEWFRRDWIVIVISLLGIVITFLSPHKQACFTAFGATILLSAIMQSIELWKTGRGRVDLQLLIISLISALLWCFYAIRREDPVLQWLTPAYTALLVTNISLWLYNRPHRKSKRAL